MSIKVRNENKEFEEVYTKGDFAIITGQMTLEANTSEQIEANIPKQSTLNIDFPDGFNKDNCVCVAIGMKVVESKGYCYGIGGTETVNSISGGLYRSVIIGSGEDYSKITLHAWQMAKIQKTGYYKLVLMKVS